MKRKENGELVEGKKMKSSFVSLFTFFFFVHQRVYRYVLRGHRKTIPLPLTKFIYKKLPILKTFIQIYEDHKYLVDIEMN